MNDIREISAEEATALWEMGIPVMYRCKSLEDTNNPNHLLWAFWATRRPPQEDDDWATATGAVVYQWGAATE